ncbi:hypothetical protein M513_05241 [Trichuris suis]|uniref:DUF4371 domain-containing protein n=1 Tax=Trichuris suis TaxID=68888 RepID=A0A085M9S8_9BILA|nr:hypothetical protein M513_05241 [Trichuris suis]
MRFIRDEQLAQDLLFARDLKTDAEGESIFRVVDHFFERKAISRKNIVAVATDAPQSMVVSLRGFVSLLKQMMHCVIHRQHTAAKHLSRHLNRWRSKSRQSKSRKVEIPKGRNPAWVKIPNCTAEEKPAVFRGDPQMLKESFRLI